MENITENDIALMIYQAEALTSELNRGRQDGFVSTGYMREKLRNIAGILEAYDGIGFETVTQSNRSGCRTSREGGYNE